MGRESPSGRSRQHGVRVVDQQVFELVKGEGLAEQIGVPLGKPVGLGDPIARADLGIQGPGPVVLLLLDLHESVEVGVVELRVEIVLLDEVAVADEGVLADAAEAVGEILDVDFAGGPAAEIGLGDGPGGVGVGPEFFHAAAAAEVVDAVIEDAVEFDLAGVGRLGAEEVFAGEVEIGADAGPAHGQVIEEEPPARAIDFGQIEEVVHVPGGVDHEAEVGIVAHAEAFEWTERVLDSAAQVREVEDRHPFDAGDHVPGLEGPLVLDELFPVRVFRHIQAVQIGARDLFLFDRHIAHVDVQTRIGRQDGIENLRLRGLVGLRILLDQLVRLDVDRVGQLHVHDFQVGLPRHHDAAAHVVVNFVGLQRLGPGLAARTDLDMADHVEFIGVAFVALGALHVVEDLLAVPLGPDHQAVRLDVEIARLGVGGFGRHHDEDAHTPPVTMMAV